MNGNSGKNKKTGIASRILKSLGILSAAYGASVLAVIGPGHWFNYAFIILGAFLFFLGTVLPAILKWAGKTGRRGRRIFLAAICLILCLCLVNFGIFESHVIKFAGAEPAEKACWIIVLGAKVKEGNIPSLEYSVRLTAAADYLRSESIRAKQEKASGKASVNLLLTGGKGADEPASESSIGLMYLKSRTDLIKIGDGPEDELAPSRIYLEEKSTSTSENLKYAREIIEAAGGSVSDSVVIVSSSFHLYRASILAKEAGFTNVSYLGSAGLRVLIPYYCVREYAAFVREHL